MFDLPKKHKWVLFFGFIAQLITAYTALGFFHPDQHFQIIEFSSYQLELPNATNYIWELNSQIRSTFQVYLFSGYVLLCKAFGVTNAFTQLTILRLCFSSLLWFFFNKLAVYFLKQQKQNLFFVLLLVNFSWFLPYSRTLFNSEMLGSLLFFVSLYLFDKWKMSDNNNANFYQLILVGFVFSLSFYTRFQIAFGLLGFGLMLLLKKEFKVIFPTVWGFVIGILLNTGLDFLFYHKWVCTPWLYFKSNIIDGVAKSFGEAGVDYYLWVLLVILTVAPLSIILFWRYIRNSISFWQHVLVLPVLFFIIGHSLVGHKEERFMFPMINVLPIIIALNIKPLINTFNSKVVFIKYGFRSVVWLSVGLNLLLLILFMFIPYAQTLSFASKLNSSKIRGKVVCIERSPLETESLAPFIFYSNSMQQVSFEKIKNTDSLFLLKPLPAYVATTFNQSKNYFKRIDSLGYKPTNYSSTFLWNINLFLQQKHANTINDIWVLYKL